MLCPVCKEHSLNTVEIEKGLDALECLKCGGRWVQSYKYWKWRDENKIDIPESDEPVDQSILGEDTAWAKLCPECGHFLTRRPVGHGLDFAIDRCSNCGGIWFDRNEWEVLRSRGLHDNVHNVFSAVWQNDVRKDQHARAVEELLEDKFGAEDYDRIVEIKKWIDGHRLKSEILAFLGEAGK